MVRVPRGPAPVLARRPAPSCGRERRAASRRRNRRIGMSYMNGHSGPVSENLSMRAGVGRSTCHPARRTDGDPAEPFSYGDASGYREPGTGGGSRGERHARARPRRARRRLRRHRHQPALHHARGLRPRRRPAPERARGAGRRSRSSSGRCSSSSPSSTSPSSCAPTTAARAACSPSAPSLRAPCPGRPPSAGSSPPSPSPAWRCSTATA